VCKLLAYIMKDGWYNHRMASLYRRGEPELEEDAVCNSFAQAAYQYACSDTVSSLSDEEKFNRLVCKAREMLLSNLPKTIQNVINRHANVIQKLHKDGVISDAMAQKSQSRYLLNMLSPEQGKAFPIPGRRAWASTSQVLKGRPCRRWLMRHWQNALQQKRHRPMCWRP
jgi:hypothetical protein